MVRRKIERTALCLGPPHSGKSVFCYLLFKFLRELGNDACVMDCDYYAPTYRRIGLGKLVSHEEFDHIIPTPHKQKLNKLEEENFCKVVCMNYDFIDHRGVIVLDGVGKHTASTECLMKLANILIVLCPVSFSPATNSEACCFVKEGQKLHPFDFYAGRKKQYIRIVTHYQGQKRASFDQSQSSGELFDLDINAIREGNVNGIPSKTKEVIREIAELLIDLTRN